MEFTVCAVLVSVLVADCVAIGTWSPTCKRADPLFSTRRFGDDSTRTLLSFESACRTKLLLPWVRPKFAPERKPKPGNVEASVAGTIDPVIGATFGPKMSVNLPDLKKYWRP